jgi:anaerobic magnesium-protoporphyrin IX monomethyl ester cyclase
VRFALINPAWTFEGSIYFGCREPHLPLEYGYAKSLIEDAGHEAVIVDGQMEALTNFEIRDKVRALRPDLSVVTTAPSYLFWRCAPPELRVPKRLIEDIQDVAGITIVIGPHSSTTPKAALHKLGAAIAVMGEPEEVLPLFANAPQEQWKEIPSIAYWREGEPFVNGGPHQSNMSQLPALRWQEDVVRRHSHHHHRFETRPEGPGAEMEVSRGCPYHCTFCAKENFRTDYRKRPIDIVLEELDQLLSAGARYMYFIDEIFLPDKELLMGFIDRSFKFGIQTRIDLWKPEMLDLLGKAGCVSIEAGVESISEAGRDQLDKKCKMSTEQLTDRLIYARQRVPFVQANLIECKVDEEEAVEQWRATLQNAGVWANKPVPLFPYPGSPDYTKIWGAPDDNAWECAHDYYLRLYSQFSDIQNERPLPLEELERMPG